MSKLLPPNSTKFEMCFDAAFSRISNIDIQTRTFNQPLLAPISVLPWLAWEMSVDIWNKEWSVDHKRQMIAHSFYVHCHKGTIGSLEQAFESVGYEIKVQEWFEMEPIGKPYTFKLHIKANQNGVSQNGFSEIFNIVNVNKNLRSHLTSAILSVESNCEITVASANCIGREVDFSTSAGELILDGTWLLDGLFDLDGISL